MDLGPEEIFLKFSEVSRNRALKRFAQFFVQPAANGLSIYYFFLFFSYLHSYIHPNKTNQTGLSLLKDR